MKTIRKLMYLLTIAAMIAIISVPVMALDKKKTVSVRKAAKTSTVSMTVGDTLRLTVKDGKKVIPIKKVTLRSSKKSVAKAAANGVIVARKQGTAVITVKYKKKSAKVKIKVKPYKSPASTDPAKKPKPEDDPTVIVIQAPDHSVMPEDCRYKFDRSQPIKFLTPYFIETDWRGSFPSDDITIWICSKRYTYSYDMHREEGRSAPTSYAISFNPSQQTFEAMANAVGALMDKAGYFKPAWVQQIVGSKPMRWYRYIRTYCATYYYGAVDDGKTFFFFAAPSITSGHVRETMYLLGGNIKDTNAVVDFGSITLDDTCESLMDMAAKLP